MRLRFCLLVLGWMGCTGAPVAPAEVAPEAAPSGPQVHLLVAVARFEASAAGVKTLPAQVLLLPLTGGAPSTLDDPASNVFHKVIPWRDGLLTIGGDQARVVHWKRTGETWTPEVLWQTAFGGEHDRIRDLEIGDVTGDGREDLVVATHDQGIVAVGEQVDDGGAWSWTVMGERPRTFVHEIELGDLDGDGRLEIYATPSEPNQTSGASQPGEVERWTLDGGQWTQHTVSSWPNTHAKEILVADLGSGPVLLALREGEVGPAGGLKAPVAVLRLDPTVEGGAEQVLATLPGERQARFLVPGDVDGDGQTELVATGMTTGTWLLDLQGDGTWRASQIDSSSGGFEQAAIIADTDGDGVNEIWVASERAQQPRQIRRYTWNGQGFRRDVVHTLEGQGLVWGLSTATF